MIFFFTGCIRAARPESKRVLLFARGEVRISFLHG